MRPAIAAARARRRFRLAVRVVGRKADAGPRAWRFGSIEHIGKRSGVQESVELLAGDGHRFDLL
jgi:hypothetical protein